MFPWDIGFAMLAAMLFNIHKSDKVEARSVIDYMPGLKEDVEPVDPWEQFTALAKGINNADG